MPNDADARALARAGESCRRDAIPEPTRTSVTVYDAGRCAAGSCGRARASVMVLGATFTPTADATCAGGLVVISTGRPGPGTCDRATVAGGAAVVGGATVVVGASVVVGATVVVGTTVVVVVGATVVVVVVVGAAVVVVVSSPPPPVSATGRMAKYGAENPNWSRRASTPPASPHVAVVATSAPLRLAVDDADRPLICAAAVAAASPPNFDVRKRAGIQARKNPSVVRKVPAALRDGPATPKSKAGVPESIAGPNANA